MATEILDLTLNASGMTRGSREAGAALDSVKDKASQTERAVAGTGRAMSAAFQVTGGSVQIASGIAATASAFGALNTQAAIFGASRVLLEVGNTARDFGALRSAVGGVTGVLGVLGAAVRANPIGAIATVVGLAASAMAVFGSRTRETTEAVKQQSTALDALLARNRDLNIRAGYGESDPRRTPGGAVDALTALRTGSQNELRVDDVAGLFGLSGQDFRYALARSGLGERALELGYQPGYTAAGGRVQVQGRWTGDFALQSVSRDQAIAAGELLLRERRTAPAGTTMSEAQEDAIWRGRSFSSGFAQAQQALEEERRRAQEEQIAAAERIADVLGNAGNELGQALFAAVQGGSGALRAALANLLTNWGQRSFGAAFDLLGRSVAGATASQKAPVGRAPGEG